MKYIKTYEIHKVFSKWKNIWEKDGKLHVSLYALANEMEESITYKDTPGSAIDPHKVAISEKEREYVHLVRHLLEGKVITFSCSDCYPSDWHTGICDKVEFHGGFEDESEDRFQVEHIQIKLEDLKEPHNIDIDEIVVHLDIDPEMYRDSKKYNIGL